MLKASQLSELIIKPALVDLQLYSEAAVDLLLFTCANESQGGTYIKQITGPALGIYQMEPNTYNDHWVNYISRHSSIMLQFLYNFDAPHQPDEHRLIYDLRFATAMARIHYTRVAEPIPNSGNVHDIWNYYKKYYNTEAGKALSAPAIDLYNQFIRP